MVHQLNLNFNEALKPRKKTDYIILHHSGVKSRHTANDIHQWHKNKGWAGIGYHVFITKDGEVYIGRPLDTVGAHTYGKNQESIGVCFEGNFDKEDMSKEQEEAGMFVLTLLGIVYPDAKLCRHNDFNNKKTCPGDNFPFERLQQHNEQNI